MPVQQAWLPGLLQGGEEEEALTEAMFQGNTNDLCLPKQYKVKKIKEIWGIRCARAF